MNVRRSGTRTSSFGVGRRENHDSQQFYDSRLYQGMKDERRQSGEEQPVPAEVLDTIICQDSRSMEQLPENSIHLVVTSPPYNVGKDYDEDLSLSEYRELLRAVFAETYRVLVPGGRVCINVANVGRRPYIPLHSYIIQDMLDLGYLMRGEILWNKGASAGVSTAWGSWMSASNPTLRDVHEYILVFSKAVFGRKQHSRKSTITRDEFLEFTKSIWTFPTESARRVEHPSPFPVELPYRCIQLYTFVGDVVLDPFCGSGTTCIAALSTQRHYVAYDIKQEYVDIARRRVVEWMRNRENKEKTN
ncbi:MAG: DNA-methyltransferase [Limnochordia bacterium]|jgi:DNA modification methylase|nr:site-specific DNA-methyltransferase [Bacillota bacterium]